MWSAHRVVFLDGRDCHNSLAYGREMRERREERRCDSIEESAGGVTQVAEDGDVGDGNCSGEKGAAAGAVARIGLAHIN